MNTLWQYLLPQHTLSRILGVLANCPMAWVKNTLIQWFIRRYAVDMQLAIETDPCKYPTFNAFFTRALKTGVRPIAAGHNSITSPADGCISQLGAIHTGRIFQAKGFDFSTRELLGGDATTAAGFEHGSFATIYLAPKDYHRVHMPVTGKLREMIYIPGQLFSVNSQSAASIVNLFARNERVVALFDTALGEMALVLVGALIVASIETTWAGLIAPNRNRNIQRWRYPDKNITLNQGDEMGRFRLGSTVVMLFSSSAIAWDSSALPGDPLIMGQSLGKQQDAG